MFASITLLSTARKPVAPATIPSSIVREFWRAESQRLGSDWVSLGETVTAILNQLATSLRCSS